MNYKKVAGGKGVASRNCRREGRYGSACGEPRAQEYMVTKGGQEADWQSAAGYQPAPQNRRGARRKEWIVVQKIAVLWGRGHNWSSLNARRPRLASCAAFHPSSTRERVRGRRPAAGWNQEYP